MEIGVGSEDRTGSSRVWGARYLFEEATKNLYGHETITWRMNEMHEDGTGVGRWETKTYDLTGNLVLWMTGDSVSQPLTEAALLD